jgi:hypothetical protein
VGVKKDYDYCAVSFLIFLPSSPPSAPRPRSSRLPAIGAGKHTCTHSPLQSDQIFIRPRINSHPTLGTII